MSFQASSVLPLFPNVGIPTFLRAPLCEDLDSFDGDIVVLGAPTDEGSPYLPGSRFGPRAIREHSLRFGASGGLYDPQADGVLLERELGERRIADAGDARVLPTNVPATFASISDMVRRVRARGALPIILGGDHAVPFPVVRAFAEPVHVIQFDAHLDYEPLDHVLEFTNGHAFRHIAGMDHVRSLTQIGIRGFRNPRASFEASVRDGNRVVTMDEYALTGPSAALDHIPEGSSCYVSIDIDALDLSLIPGCVSAEPDGMTYAQLRRGLQAIADTFQVVGFDLCEVNPLLDVATGVTAYLAAYTIVEFLGQICAQPGYRETTKAPST